MTKPKKNQDLVKTGRTHPQGNLMLVTALNNRLGFDKVASVVNLADAAELDIWLDPRTMIGPAEAT